MKPKICTLTERGQVSVPSALRRAMGLKAGVKLQWEQVSDSECRVSVRRRRKPLGPVAVLGAARRGWRGSPKTTEEWLALLRAGEY